MKKQRADVLAISSVPRSDDLTDMVPSSRHQKSEGCLNIIIIKDVTGRQTNISQADGFACSNVLCGADRRKASARDTLRPQIKLYPSTTSFAISNLVLIDLWVGMFASTPIKERIQSNDSSAALSQHRAIGMSIAIKPPLSSLMACRSQNIIILSSRIPYQQPWSPRRAG